ncbi:MAG: hypothetical protein ABSD21_11250 [Rhizomicrobium sp.]|jgi:hypothetical protein
MRKTDITLSALFCVATLAWVGSASALNPQPEPPGEHSMKATMHNTVSEPPDPCLAAHTTAIDKHTSERTRTGQLNQAALACAHSGLGPNRLNPQPLPP